MENVLSAEKGRQAVPTAIPPGIFSHPYVALAQRMHASGEPASTIAGTLGVSRATVYRVLRDETVSAK